MVSSVLGVGGCLLADENTEEGAIAGDIELESDVALRDGRLGIEIEGVGRPGVYCAGVGLVSVDLDVPMLSRMFDCRCRGYEAVGYTILRTLAHLGRRISR